MMKKVVVAINCTPQNRHSSYYTCHELVINQAKLLSHPIDFSGTSHIFIAE